MTLNTKVLWAVVSLVCLVVGLGIFYFTCQKILSIPFRAANDALHKQGAPITLDFLIPGGTHIDKKMTIGQVIRIHFEKPRGGLNRFIQKISASIPLKYRFLGTTGFYLFWTFLFFVFFRIFTWMRYIVALSASFLAGALVYFFMPDLILGRIDDVVFLIWAIAFAAAGWWYSKRRGLRSSYT
jgi:hypothetical protein